jgi:hypothetical protein
MSRQYTVKLAAVLTAAFFCVATYGCVNGGKTDADSNSRPRPGEEQSITPAVTTTPVEYRPGPSDPAPAYSDYGPPPGNYSAELQKIEEAEIEAQLKEICSTEPSAPPC